MGKLDLLRELLALFLDENPQRLRDLKQAIEDGDVKQIHYLAHTIKGVAANLGGSRLQHKASLLEVAAKQSDISQFTELLAHVSASSEQLMLCFEQYMEQTQASVN